MFFSPRPVPTCPASAGRERVRWRWSRAGFALGPGLVCVLVLASSAHAVQRVSVDSLGGESNGASDFVAISGDGRFIAFESDANNLVADDDNGRDDIFVYDQISGETVRVSLSSTGEQANKDCHKPDISRDGRFVVFESNAATLVADDTNGVRDVFLRDRDPDQNGIFDEPGHVSTTRVSLDAVGAERDRASSSARISGDANYVAFEANRSSGKSDILVYDRSAGVSVLVSATSDGSSPDGSSENPAMSFDGRFVAFESNAINLVSPDLNLAYDVFLVDRDPDGDGVFEGPGDTALFLVSQKPSGNQASGRSGSGSISDDGRYVAFWSAASDITVSDTNSKRDVFLRDMVAGSTSLVSRTAAGVSGSADSAEPTLSADGRFVVFQSAADDLVPDDINGKKDVFRLDRDPDRNGIFDDSGPDGVTLESIAADGTQGSGDSGEFPRPRIAADGTFIAFTSAASNLVMGDTNSTRDVFVGLSEFCGNLIQDPGEICEDGNFVDGDGCDFNCTISACGNAVVAPQEGCDDGNLVDGDGCDSNCTSTSCGNGIVTSGEVCDDANPIDGDGCDSNCTPTACGNEVQTSGEECDLGGANGLGNCCTDQCVLEDVDADEVCDELDLLDLPGGEASRLRVRATRQGSSRRDGIVRLKLEIDPGAQTFYADAADFLAAGETNGFSFSLYAGAAEPTATDTPIFAVSIDPGDCLFGGDVGDRRRVYCRTVPAEPGGALTKLKMKRGPTLSVLAITRRADVLAPDDGPLYAVLNARDPEQLDFAARADDCARRGALRSTLTCR